MSRIWLLLAVIGTIVPWYFFYQQFMVTGWGSPLLFLEALGTSNVSIGTFFDLLISSVVFWLLIFGEPNKLPTPKLALLVALNLGVGLSCALPLYIYFKTNRSA